MASSHKTLIFFFFTFLLSLLSSSRAYTFTVGGRDGWTLHPSENYNQWSSRLRFIVNDALHFKYDGGSDSVLEVNNGDYQNCTTKNPITTLTGGDSFFTLNRSGPFYFISGNKSNCNQGQKLKVVVISPKSKPSMPPAASPPGSSSPISSPPGSSSPVPPSESPISSPPQPGTTIPATPAASPGGTGSGPYSPAGSPAGSISSPPAGSPASSPAGSESSSPAGSPAYSPEGGVSSSPAGGPMGNNPAGAPMGNNPADANAPPPRESSSEKAGASTVLILPLVMILFGYGFLN